MSQYWHGHWIEDSFKPNRLMNWEVPKWYPSWPDRHCTTTKIQANDRGYILNPKNKSKSSPWGNFKGTWDLPKRIDKTTAHELSAIPESKKKAWELHVMKNLKVCEKSKSSKIRIRGGGEEDKRKEIAESTAICEYKKDENESTLVNKQNAEERETIDTQVGKHVQGIEKIKLQEDTVQLKTETLEDITQNEQYIRQASETENKKLDLKEDVVETQSLHKENNVSVIDDSGNSKTVENITETLSTHANN